MPGAACRRRKLLCAPAAAGFVAQCPFREFDAVAGEAVFRPENGRHRLALQQACVADEAREDMRENLPEEFDELMDTLEELESSYVVGAVTDDDEIELKIEGFDDEGEEVIYTLRFDEVEILENEGINASPWTDEDGDTFSDCEFLFSEIYIEEGRPEIHMLFDNNGLKYLTFRCSEAYPYRAANE